MKLPASKEPARYRVNFDKINREALRAPLAVLRRLLPKGRIIAHEYVSLNPKRADKHAGSFRVNLRSFKWADFACADARGGDATSLIAYLQGVSQPEAARLLARMLSVNIEGDAA